MYIIGGTTSEKIAKVIIDLSTKELITEHNNKILSKNTKIRRKEGFILLELL